MNSIEVKAMPLQTGPDPSTNSQTCTQNFFRQHPEQRPGLKRSESSSNLARPSAKQLAQFQIKYKALQQDYNKSLRSCKARNEQYQQQKHEVLRLKDQIARESKDIERLKQMLEFNQKQDSACQTDPDPERNWSRRNKQRWSDLTSETRCEEAPMLKKHSRVLKKHATNEIQADKLDVSYRAEKTQKNQKYKFVPTLKFTHL